MKTMTLNLSDAEMEAVEGLCTKRSLTKSALVRQCLRLYQAVEERLDRGEKLFFEDSKKQKSELLLV